MTRNAARGVLRYVLVMVGAVVLMLAALMLTISGLPVTNWTITAMVMCTVAGLMLLYCVISVAVAFIQIGWRNNA